MLVLTNGTLIDGTGKEPIEKAVVVIEANTIKSVGPEIAYPEGSPVIDLGGRVIMPGLIDCHLHLGGFVIDDPNWQFSSRSFMPWFSSFLWDYLRHFAKRRRLAIENGVTTIRSAGDNYPDITKLRDRIELGKLTGPRIFAPGPIFTAPGGHPAGTIYRRNRYIVEHATRQVDDAEVAREEVRKLAEGGVDCIKAVYSRINLMDLAHDVPQLDLRVLEATVDEAHRHNLRTMVHAGSPEETRNAVTVGADSIEHGIGPDGDPIEFTDTLIAMMVDKGTYYVPTVAVSWALKNTYPGFLAKVKATVKKLHDSSVKIATGTDSGMPGVVIGKSIHIEMDLLVEAGLSPMEAIVTATRNAAGNLGQEHHLGTIEEGKLADIIVVSGNPLEQASKTGEIEMVIKNGEVSINRLRKGRFPQA
ncbi:MAG: amidohydrolase family protein [Dehalococcoidales bacterium]|nr:MAG: amidohydrolase family protein [Dehalococcoidales bacterium]